MVPPYLSLVITLGEAAMPETDVHSRWYLNSRKLSELPTFVCVRSNKTLPTLSLSGHSHQDTTAQRSLRFNKGISVWERFHE